MSKAIKQMEMAALTGRFKGVRDLVFMSSIGVDAITDNNIRLSLRKKNIQMQIVKNSLARRVFQELGIATEAKLWVGPTLVAWGSNSIAELSKEFDTLIKKNDKVKDKLKVKAAIADGQVVTFEQALKMPTKAEAIGRVIALALAPAARLVAQLLSPGANLAGQIKSIAEKKPEEAPAAEAAPAPDAAPVADAVAST